MWSALFGCRLCPMLNSQRDSAAGSLIEDEVFTGFCGSKFLNPRLRVIESHCRLYRAGKSVEVEEPARK
jgi:hypothetical protein